MGPAQFDLEKQVQIEQDYITKLQGQIGDLTTNFLRLGNP